MQTIETQRELPTEPEVTAIQAEAHGLSGDEFARIKEFLGRTPTYTELGVYSVMWSEHCSYKNSIAQIKTLPRDGEALLAKAGEENAGAVDIGDGLAVVFKIESHNHPSAVEPYQGAATGVGGILRDVFTMGARPVAVLDSLRFGPLDVARNRYLMDGVVRGVGDYGNCFGVPNIGGEVRFAPCYSGNPLVNAMAVGIVDTKKIARAIANRPGASVLVVGSSTGRDGIHGATFASEELTEESEARRPSVQIGDPFTEKLLLEATLEVIDRDLIVGIQDMGAAGITCSCSEMAARGKCGIEIEASDVPMRESGMTPYEILLSESQERMLVVVEPKYESEVKAIFARWGIGARKIGQVTGDGRFRVKWFGQVVCDVPADTLVLGGRAPVYVREQKRPAYLDGLAALDVDRLPETDFAGALEKLLASPNVADKTWVTQQYDQTVRTGTAVRPGGDGGLLRLRSSRQGIAAATDGHGRYCHIEPRAGARHTVFEAARNVAALGARPTAVTNCLNFGNPYKPEMYYLFAEAVAGIGEACRALDTPVTGGNVSFYNEVPEMAVYPTPVIGMIGILPDVNLRVTVPFKKAGDLIFVVGNWDLELGGSEYLEAVHGKVGGKLPTLDMQAEKRTIDFIVRIIDHGLIASCHDVSDGGVAVALAECSLRSEPEELGFKVGATIKGRADRVWFGEGGGRFVISVQPERAERLVDLAYNAGVPLQNLGVVAAGDFCFDGAGTLERKRAHAAYFESLPRALAITADIE
jgi:phosphoribosylformylglycinamidine synthase